jgi:hypothetical protein
MENFRESLDILKTQLRNRFWELREQNPEIVFMDEDAIENLEIEDYFDRRNDINGTVHEICIPKIDKDGIHTIDVNDPLSRKVIGLSDLASIEDVISLVELMEIKCK